MRAIAAAQAAPAARVAAPVAMIYKFKCKACGDLIMLGPNGDQLLRLLGREPSAQGIIEVPALGDALRLIERAIEDAEAASPDRAGGPGGGDEPGRDKVGLRQRLWPMRQMLERAQAAGEPIVWGV